MEKVQSEGLGQKKGVANKPESEFSALLPTVLCHSESQGKEQSNSARGLRSQVH